MSISTRLAGYWSVARAGVAVLTLLAIVRFLMLPVFGVGYDTGTTYTSLTILFVIVALYTSFRASRTPGTTYLDMLGILVLLSLALSILISLGILVDDLGGIETYYTAPGHGGGMNVVLHIAGHMTGVVFLPIVFWIPAALMLRFLGTRPGKDFS
jgi:hypothetical protein